MSTPAYLYILLASLSIPLLRSFEPRVFYISRWKPLLISFSLTALFFITWDIIFTKNGVWGFNPRYLVGINIINLPIEEWLFFFIIPYSSVFIYVCLNHFIRKDYLKDFGVPLARFVGLALLVIALLNPGRAYTFWNFLFTGLFLSYHGFILKNHYLGRFWVAYLVHLIPFLIVNGILTGSYVDEPIVWYNNAENLGIRIGTIPVEDTVYAMLLLMMNITFLERFSSK
ncbi:MAG: lycopene cyclase domain-containing protein [Cyclobacteriaceae bacterium]